MLRILLVAGLLWFATTALATINLSPASVTFTAAAGSTPAPQDVVVTTSNSAAWSASDTSPWFDAHPTTGASGALIHITFPFNLSGYAPGTYTQTITFTASGSSSKNLTVKMILYTPTPTPTPSPSPLPTSTPSPVPTATPSATPTPPSIVPLFSVTLQWGNPVGSLSYIRVYDDGPAGFIMIRQIRAAVTLTQTATLMSLLPLTYMYPGSLHIYYVSAVSAEGLESALSNPCPVYIPVQ